MERHLPGVSVPQFPGLVLLEAHLDQSRPQLAGCLQELPLLLLCRRIPRNWAPSEGRLPVCEDVDDAQLLEVADVVKEVVWQPVLGRLAETTSEIGSHARCYRNLAYRQSPQET